MYLLRKVYGFSHKEIAERLGIAVSTVEKHLIKAVEQCDPGTLTGVTRTATGAIMTNIVGFEARASIERQAREWLIRLDGDEPLTAAETAALREWMARGPAHHNELARICKFWRQANVLTELAIPLKAPPAPTHRGRLVLRIALAASVVLACSILGSGWLERSAEPVSRAYVTAVGEQKTVFLSDGSSIQLNTDTQVQVIYTSQSRQIHLWRGEALFSATHEPNRPFEVFANDSVVRAIGTAFAVHLEGNQVDVTVTTGAVDVVEVGGVEPVASDGNQHPDHERSPARRGRLRAGQTATVGGANHSFEVQQLPGPELQRRLAWQGGVLVFSGEPLSEVVEQLNRYSPMTLRIADPSLASVAIGGRFRIGDLDAVLDVLHNDFAIQARRIDEREIRLESARHL